MRWRVLREVRGWKAETQRVVKVKERVVGKRVVLAGRLPQQAASCMPGLPSAYLLHLMFCLWRRRLKVN
jgi:hypothetical protein